MYPSSVVHTGVKSLGCENRIAQPSPIQLWNSSGPSVVSALKSGAVELMRSVMVKPPQDNVYWLDKSDLPARPVKPWQESSLLGRFHRQLLLWYLLHTGQIFLTIPRQRPGQYRR